MSPAKVIRMTTDELARLVTVGERVSESLLARCDVARCVYDRHYVVLPRGEVEAIAADLGLLAEAARGLHYVLDTARKTNL